MKERLEEMEAEYKHMQETVAFKDNELEVGVGKVAFVKYNKFLCRIL